MKKFVFPVVFTSLEAASALYNEPYMIWLDSNKLDHPQSRYSYICFQPSEPIEFQDFEYQSDLPPFQGGYAGFKTYEGDEFFKFYSNVLSFDHHTGQAWYIVHAENEAEANDHYNFLYGKIRGARPTPEFSVLNLNWESNFSKDEYKKSISRIIEHVLNGDIFQANLTQRFCAPRPSHFHSFSHYLNLRRVNPAPYSAYLNWVEIQISSASPESFLSLSRDGLITTRPIKGTSDNAQALSNSLKDRAENIMIVDLMRNDLSKISMDESINVHQLCELQSFAGLYHLVSEISGKILSDLNAKEALNACFPGGSITGAPKIKAMEVIDKIEQVKRGVYCGSIGWIGIDGAMDMNIAIRTITATQDNIFFGVGGGITAVSEPETEYQETILKAQKIFKSFSEVSK
jgi:para-aminobenzoate synthetase component 1